MSITTIIGLIGALQGLVLAGVIASLGGTGRRPNLALAGLLTILSLSLAAIVAQHAALFDTSWWLLLAEYTLALSFPATLWYYATLVLGDRPRVAMWVHMVPLGAWLVYLTVFSLGWLGTGAGALRWLPPILLLVAYMASYTIVVAGKAWQSRAGDQALVSHGVVLRVLVVLLLAIHAAQTIRYRFRDVAALADIVPVVGTAAVYVISILAVRQSRLFAGRQPTGGRKKYEASALSPERAEAIRERLLEVMERDHPYRNENLNLADLATRLSVSRAHLSQVINASLGKGFREFLNEYRVQEAVGLLQDPASSHLTIEAIGYSVGFRSRSAFHSTFQRLTGETPSKIRPELS